MNTLSEPDVANDPNRFRKLMKEQSDLQPIVDAYKEYKACKQTIEDSLAILDEESDEEMRELAKEELNEAKSRLGELEQKLKILLLPKDPNDDKNVIVEIRAGAGGEEAALFAAEIYRMYVHYAERRGWKVETLEADETGIGGMKSVNFMVTGAGAYSVLKYESGVHRVQRVPETLLERLAQKTEKYHLDGDTRAMIALASSLHDIGKIGVDEKILNKPGKLTKEEFEIMKTHTVIGAEMLEQLGIYQDEPLVKIAHQICRWHHERYDGKGYPDGLVGDEIPISAQVVSVADVYDALASERVYKKAVPNEKVLEMILHGECGQFNPILIECLQEISSRIRSECYDEEQET